MSNVARYLLALVASAPLWLSGCESGPDVRAEYDHAADFGKYRTYGFVAQLSPGADTTQFKSLAMQTLQAAAAMEMEKRGYTRAEAPDVVINFKGKLEEKTDIESTPAPYYGAGWGYHGMYGSPYEGALAHRPCPPAIGSTEEWNNIKVFVRVHRASRPVAHRSPPRALPG